MRFRNASHAFLTKLGDVATHGEDFKVRGHLTRELCHQTVMLERPLERCIVVPGRRNNIFAAIAETVWVIAGRNDLEFLKHYLPRSADFSDDGGLTWRAGYGPRLRSWHDSVDQLGQVVRLLSESESSRRAVMSVFDPDEDFQESSDVPCTNWLHFTVRNGALNLNVTVRSNDLMWGFSGINTFEWSVLQEMVAHWLDKDVGTATFFISSLHLYERHFARASEILSAPYAPNLYQQAPATKRFATAFDDLPDSLARWFELEHGIRTGQVAGRSLDDCADPLLKDFLIMLQAYWAFGEGKTPEALTLLGHVGDPALAAAGRSYFEWKSALPVPRASGGPITVTPLGAGELREYITLRNRTQQRPGGEGWAYPGEVPSAGVLLTRALDRLFLLEPSAYGKQFEAAADIFILCLKIQERLPHSPDNLDARSIDAARDGSIAAMIADYDLGTTNDASVEALFAATLQASESVKLDATHIMDTAEKLERVKNMAIHSSQLFSSLAHKHPVQVRQLVHLLVWDPGASEPGDIPLS